jgi:chitodextrinase
VQIVQAAQIPGTATVEVTENGTLKTYEILFKVNSDANLADLLLNGVSLSGFDAGITEYYVPAVSGSTAPTVAATAVDPHVYQVDITQAASVPGTAVIKVTAEDRLTTKTYTLHFVINESLGGTATASTINNASADFAPSKAFDQNNSTMWASETTDIDPMPWWQLDLGEAKSIIYLELQTSTWNDVHETRRNFEVQASNTADFTTYTVLAAQGGTTLPYKHVWKAEVDGSTPYRYVRVAKTASERMFIGEFRAYSSSMAASDTTAPTAPSGLTATAVSSSQIDLSWTASTDDVGVTGYAIYRDAVEVDTTTATTYSDQGLAADQAYSYTVRAYDAADNESADSNTANETTHMATWGNAIRYEAEDLSVTGIINTYATQLDAGASNGEYGRLQSGAAGHGITYTANVASAGTYNIKVGMRKAANGATVKLLVDGVQLGGTHDLYAASAAFAKLDFGDVTLSQAGNHTFRLVVTTKNTSSTGYEISTDYIELDPILVTRYETEDLSVSGIINNHLTQTEAGASNGKYTRLESGAAGHGVTYTANVTEAGTYNVRVGVRKSDQSATIKLLVDGVQLGGTFDLYAASAEYTALDFGDVLLSTTGQHTFRFVVTTKNTSSSGYYISTDYIEITS